MQREIRKSLKQRAVSASVHKAAPLKTGPLKAAPVIADVATSSTQVWQQYCDARLRQFGQANDTT